MLHTNWIAKALALPLL